MVWALDGVGVIGGDGRAGLVVVAADVAVLCVLMCALCLVGTAAHAHTEAAAGARTHIYGYLQH